MNEEGEDNLIQMGFRRYLTVIFLLLLLLAGAAVGAMAALAYTLFWGSAVKIKTASTISRPFFCRPAPAVVSNRPPLHQSGAMLADLGEKVIGPAELIS
jgi:hypothetical protein